MTTAVRVSEELVKEAKIYSKIDKRSITGQIEHWARIGMLHDYFLIRGKDANEFRLQRTTESFRKAKTY